MFVLAFLPSKTYESTPITLTSVVPKSFYHWTQLFLPYYVTMTSLWGIDVTNPLRRHISRTHKWLTFKNTHGNRPTSNGFTTDGVVKWEYCHKWQWWCHQPVWRRDVINCIGKTRVTEASVHVIVCGTFGLNASWTVHAPLNWIGYCSVFPKFGLDVLNLNGAFVTSSRAQREWHYQEYVLVRFCSKGAFQRGIACVTSGLFWWWIWPVKGSHNACGSVGEWKDCN